MIDKELIKKLHAAGVDSAVIINLLLDDQDEEPSQEVAPVDPEPSEKAEPAAPAPAATEDKILAAIERLTGAVQASNIRRIGGDPETETADAVLASIINPKKE